MSSEPELDIQKLRSSIFHLYQERNTANDKLVGVQVLTDQLEQKTEECNVLKSKFKQLEVLLSRAENRIAQLSKLNGKDGTNRGGIVTPGVSKKLLETITRENTKLKLALEHVLNKQPNAVDLSVENKDLHNLVLALKDELEQNRKETEELREALRAVETDDTMALQQQIANLTAKVTHIERSLKAKQVYCESVVSENERLKANMEAVKSERITQLATLKKLSGQHPTIKDVLELTWSGDDVDGQDVEKNMREIHSLKRTINELTEKLASKEEESHKKIEELKEDFAISLQETEKQREEFTRKIQELSHTNAMMYKEMEKLKIENQEFNGLNSLMQDQCKGYENDFKMERQEKQKLASDNKKLADHNQYLQNLCKKHQEEKDRITEAIRMGFEKKQQKQQPTTTSPPQQTRWQGGAAAPAWTVSPATTKTPQQTRWIDPAYTNPYPMLNQGTGYTPPHFNPMRQEQVMADCASGGDNLRQHKPGDANSCLECPVCHMILPPDEIEGHLNDCDGRR